MDSGSAHARRLSLSVIVKSLIAYTAGTSDSVKESQPAAVTSCGQFEEKYISFPPLDDTCDDAANGPTARIRNNKPIPC
jgi:hypothetical protein